MAISLLDLPPKMRDQAVRKWQEQQRGKTINNVLEAGNTKFHSVPTEVKNIRFGSKLEARRYLVLMGMEQNGEIRGLRMQQDFTLQEAYTTTEGKRVRAIRYRADFTYEKRTDINGTSYWTPVVEDTKCKATKTAEYQMKKKMLQDRTGIEILEVFK